MSNEPVQIYEMSPGESVTVKLPRGIGRVEIRTAGVNGPTGYPVIGVGLYSATECSPAADGRLYVPLPVHRDDEAALIGTPTPWMLEQQRQVAWVEKVFELHNSGNHTECSETCPVRAAEAQS